VSVFFIILETFRREQYLFKTVQEGQNISLNCNVTVSTGERVEWDLLNNRSYRGVVYTITHVTRQEEALYSCYLFRGTIGRPIEAVYLTVECK